MNTQMLRKLPSDQPIYQRMLSADAGWEHLNFEARTMGHGESWEGNTGECEYGFILLSGNFSAYTNKGEWHTEHGRDSVFNGMAHTLYLPAHTQFRIVAKSETLDLAAGWCKSYNDTQAKFKSPGEVAVEIRGGGNATRQINSLIEPGFGSSRLVAVEVYTPAGNWSSYPAHKHDERKISPEGVLLEADLEEFYFFRFNHPNAYAIQHVYNSDRSINELMQLQDRHLVMVPEGYHPVVAAHAYPCYYLNFLAGSDQSLANTPDPDHEWIFSTWTDRDERVPMVTSEMNKKQNHGR